MSALEKCGVCGHPKMAHDLQPQPIQCVNCLGSKATKLNAKHSFKTKEQMGIK